MESSERMDSSWIVQQVGVGGEGSEESFSGAASHTSLPLWGACWREHPAFTSAPRVKDKDWLIRCQGSYLLGQVFVVGSSLVQEKTPF